MIHLACDSRRLNVTVDPKEQWIEVRCRDRYCGAGKGSVVIHRFKLQSGELMYTSRFKEPARRTGT